MLKKTKAPVAAKQVDAMIRIVRGTRVMLDSDLAQIYGVSTKAFNQAVKRNRTRFPEDFMFRLSQDEAVRVSRSQTVTLKRGQNIKYRPTPSQNTVHFRPLRAGTFKVANCDFRRREC